MLGIFDEMLKDFNNLCNEADKIIENSKGDKK